MNGCRCARGLTLIELLVAMLLGALLSSGVVAAYLGAKRQYHFDDQMARLQENGRFALRLLGRELSMGGFYGGLASVSGLASQAVAGDCAAHAWALSPVFPLDLVNDHPGGSEALGVEGTVYTCLDGGLVRPNTDLLAVKRTFAEASLWRGVPASTLSRGTTVLWYLRIEEGESPQWQQHRPRDLTGPAFDDPGLSLWEASAKLFFVRRYASRPGDALPALCAEVLAGEAMTTRCLVEGVEDMQFEFGIDTDGDRVANVYRDAPAPGEMQRAVAARIHLLLRSPAPLPGYRDRRDYRLGSRSITAPGDGYLRRVFSTSVRLRNAEASHAWRMPP